jgi:hypothetical protein
VRPPLCHTSPPCHHAAALHEQSPCSTSVRQTAATHTHTHQGCHGDIVWGLDMHCNAVPVLHAGPVCVGGIPQLTTGMRLHPRLHRFWGALKTHSPFVNPHGRPPLFDSLASTFNCIPRCCPQYPGCMPSPMYVPTRTCETR